MSLPPTPLFSVLELLAASKVRFIVVGGLAMILQGLDTLTQDVDISFALDAENCEELVAFLNAYHPRPPAVPASVPFVLNVATLTCVRFLNLKTDLGEIDLLPHPAGIDSFQGLLARASWLDLGTFTVAVASLDDLIAMKEAAGRPKDQVHLMELRALKKILDSER